MAKRHCLPHSDHGPNWKNQRTTQWKPASQPEASCTGRLLCADTVTHAHSHVHRLWTMEHQALGEPPRSSFATFRGGHSPTTTASSSYDVVAVVVIRRPFKHCLYWGRPNNPFPLSTIRETNAFLTMPVHPNPTTNFSYLLLVFVIALLASGMVEKWLEWSTWMNRRILYGQVVTIESIISMAAWTCAYVVLHIYTYVRTWRDGHQPERAWGNPDPKSSSGSVPLFYWT